MKISIITISLNDVENLKRTIESVRAQSFTSFEHIVMDGFSNDGTQEFLKQLNYPQLKFTSEKDSGLYNAMNKGILKCSGDYIVFLNAGDTFHTADSLLEVSKFLGQADFVYFDIFLKFSNFAVLRRYPNNISYKFWLTNHLCHQACFYSKAVFESIGNFDETLKIAADHDHFLRIFKNKSLRKLHAPFPSVIYDMSGISSNADNRAKTLAEMNSSERKHLPRIKRFFYGRRVMFNQSIEAKTNRLARFFLRTFLSPLGLDPSPEDSVVDHRLESIPTQPFKLNVLIVNTHETKGGAAVASRRLHQTLLAEGILSTMLVLEKNSNSDSVVKAQTKKGLIKILEIFLNIFEVIIKALASKAAGGSLISPGLAAWTDLSKNIAYLRPDVVHLNWICGNFACIEDLPKISAPIVWTMHDMWGFCGAEHVTTEKCFQHGYRLTKIGDFTNLLGLANRFNWLRKKWVYSKIKDISLTGPSSWMVEHMKKSPLLEARSNSIVPNGLDSTVFFPKDKKIARELFNFPQDKKILMFGAVDVTKDPNKGFHLLVQALQILEKNPLANDLYVVVCGYMDGSSLPKLSFPIQSLGYVSDNAMLAAVYSCVDVMVVPSKIESFGQSATEAMACGVPVVSFDTSGLKDIVDHQKTGFLAKCYDPEDFAKGIMWVLEDEQRWKTLSENSRSKILNNFTSEIVAQQFIKLYEQSIRSGISWDSKTL